ncbi:MAG: ACP S-malonyltransferase [bacterium]
MAHIGFIFPGQGSQQVGMGQELHESDPGTKKIFDEASEAIRVDLADLCFKGPRERLDQTINTQPALLTVSYAFFRYLQKKKPIVPEAVAGHSLGEYSALAAAGAGNFLDLLKLVRQRASFMQEVEGAMAAVIGLDQSTLSRITGEIGEVWPVNLNCPGQIVVAGRHSSVEKAMSAAKDAGAKIAKLLNVSIPSHCPLMLEAAAKLEAQLEKTPLKFPLLPIIQNYSAREPQDLDELKDNLAGQLSSPVRWEESINRMVARGIDSFIEIGPGKVLAGLVKRIDRKVSVTNVMEILK